MRIQSRYSAGSYQIRANVRLNSGSYVNTAWYNITDAPHYIEFSWVASTAAGALNGSFTLWIDGSQRVALTGLDNNTLRVDAMRLGLVSSATSATRGTEFFDKFESRRWTYIGQ